MASYHTAGQLKTVRDAIDRIEKTGASATIGDMTYTEANISALYRREETLMKRLNRQNGRRPQIKAIKIV